MKDYYAEFLQRKISGYTLYDEVSKVSKPQNLTQKQTFDTFDTDLPRVNQKLFICENTKHRCSNCGLEMNLIEVDTIWFCPFGCESLEAEKL